MLGAGMHGFMPPVLAQYRKNVLNDKRGAELQKLAVALRKKGYEIVTPVHVWLSGMTR